MDDIEKIRERYIGRYTLPGGYDRMVQVDIEFLLKRVEELKDHSRRLLREDLGKTIERAEKAEGALATANGAMASQDDRERQAGERCKVPYEIHGCDWPDAVAEALIVSRDALAETMNGQGKRILELETDLATLKTLLGEAYSVLLYCASGHPIVDKIQKALDDLK